MKRVTPTLLALLALAVPTASQAAGDGSWIRSGQLSSGAIPIHPSGIERRVLPYDANIAARGMIAESTDNCAAAQAWMQWYTNHLNWPDRYGVYATTYDWTVNTATGVETTAQSYDSADSYAATFMSLARQGATDCPAIRTWLQTNKYAVNSIGHVMTDPQVLAANGLTWPSRTTTCSSTWTTPRSTRA